ncbi:protein kinase domain-containing protein [Hyalangium versicolor]|uniref:protein kinase domain-containing protein n=1 Tax=Hyalangium versicolor TaxID=2861190 RepID=UPI001CCEDEB7|nr:protein kinase [Hyalangium versicolor]
MREDKGTPFGKYELLERLGVGGMATVYRARYMAAPGVTKLVVIKRVLSELAETPSFVELFIHEARISVGLSHGNIVQVFDFGQVNGEYYLAMELVEGQPLSRVLKRAQTQGLSRMPQPLAASIAIDLCKGLHHAHTRTDEQRRPLGLVHRDVSPDNILISYDGDVKITDFGIAKVQMAGRPITAAGMVKGKYLYLSPEQAQGQGDLDARSDVYAVGVVLYRMLCGRLPVEGQDVEVMDRIVKGDIPPALEVNPELDGMLARIVMRALATSRGARFQSAEELQLALTRWVATRAPLFTGNTLKYLMGWLYGEELKALGQSSILPQEFQDHLALWRDGQGTAEGRKEGLGKARTVQLSEAVGPSRDQQGLGAAPDEDAERETDVLTQETREAATTQAGSNRRGRRPRWVLGAAAVAGALLLVFLVVHGPPPLEIHSEPPGAQVRLDGEIRGVTPLVVEDVARSQPHTVELILLGWKRWEQVFEPGALDKKVEVELEELQQPPPPPVAAAPEPPPEPTKDPVRPKPTTRPPTPGLKITAASKPSQEAATAKYKQGLKQLARGQLVSAKESFWECLANDPKAARCFRRLGEVSARLGNKEEALEYYGRFLELDPRGDGAGEARAYIREQRRQGGK